MDRNRLLLAAMAVWSILFLGHFRDLLVDFFMTLHVMSDPSYLRVVFTGFPVAVIKVARFLALTCLIVVGFAGVGLQSLVIASRSRPGGWEWAAVGLLLGFAILGTVYFAFALTGLIFPSLVYFMFLAGFLSPALWNTPKGLTMPRIGRMDSGTAWKALLYLSAGVTVFLMCLPDTNGDAMFYHLAVSEQAFRSHRLTDLGFMASYNHPLTAELVYGLAVAAGDDVLPHFIQFIPFAASLVLLGGWCARNGGSEARLIALGVILSMGQVTQMMLVAKNDLAAAAYPVAGVVFLVDGMASRSRRRQFLGALLLGCGAAIKQNALPLIALAACVMGAWSVRSRRLRVLPAWIVMAAVPAAPWILKSWLMFGDPFWPAMPYFFPRSLTDPETASSLRLLFHRGEAGYRFADLPSVLLRSLAMLHPAVAVAFPLGLVRARNAGRGTSIMMFYAFAGIALLWAVFPLTDMRYALPLFIIITACLAAIITRLAAGWPRRAVRLALAATIVSGLLPMGNLLLSGIEPGYALPYLAGKIGHGKYLELRLTTFNAISKRMRALPDLGRILLLDGVYSYRLPGIRIRGRFDGRSWAWTAARESRDAGEISKKMRQTGCGYLLFNFVRENEQTRHVEPFKWNNRTLVIWKDFVGRYLDIAVPPSTVDQKNGGFCLYRRRCSPRPRPPEYLPYLPGIFAPLYTVKLQFQRGDINAYLFEALRLRRILPNVDSVNDMVAFGYRSAGCWKKAYDAYRGGILHGTLDYENVYGMSLAAEELGKSDEAARLSEYARTVYPLLGRPKE